MIKLDIKLQQEIVNVNKGVFIYDIVAILGLIVANHFNMSMILGLVLGTMVALMNFTMLAKTVEKSVEMSPEGAKLYASTQYFIRMIIVALVLFVTVKSKRLHLIGVLLGLIGPKVVILSRNILFNKINIYCIIVKLNNIKFE